MKKLLKILTNKFVVTGVAFAAWMICFDQNNWTAREEKAREIRQTERNIAYLSAEIIRMEDEYNELKNNPERLEQYAREQYRMKRDNEDVYIIEH
jgi:cell division protein FtsB